jgi:hypothetical protein
MIKHPSTRAARIVQRSAVGWFNLRLMIRSGIKALVSATTGAQAPRREVLAALDLAHQNADAIHLASSTDTITGPVWVDYIADLGDGFAATHSVAWLVGRDYLAIGEPGKQVAQPIPESALHEAQAKDFPPGSQLLPAGEITVFGGDLVYPFATQSDYADRTIGPYFAARPWDQSGARKSGRQLYSIPGNHDWYDGLIAYVYNFCQPKRWHGAWQVQQARSYFAREIAHGFWIWGVDLAIANDLDAPQLEYFTKQANLLKEGEKVLLCVPKPAWVERDLHAISPGEEADSWDTWSKIETMRRLVEETTNGARVAAVISGDLHHYTRYQTGADGADDACQYITCGGGGAFTLGTYSAPEELSVFGDKVARIEATYPSREDSRPLRNQVYKIVFRHKIFCAALATIMLALVWFFEASTHTNQGPQTALDLLWTLVSTRSGFFDYWYLLLTSMIFSPQLTAITFIVLGGFLAFAASARGLRTPWWAALIAGFIHFFVQLSAAFLIVVTVWALLAQPYVPLPLYILLITGSSILLGWLICGGLFALYLRVANATFGLHEMELYSSQSIEDWKCFMRMRVDKTGVTIFPIGLRHVAHKWITAKNAGALSVLANRAGANLMQALKMPVTNFDVPNRATHLFVPEPPLKPELIEKPIFIPANIGIRV